MSLPHNGSIETSLVRVMVREFLSTVTGMFLFLRLGTALNQITSKPNLTPNRRTGRSGVTYSKCEAHTAAAQSGISVLPRFHHSRPFVGFFFTQCVSRRDSPTPTIPLCPGIWSRAMVISTACWPNCIVVASLSALGTPETSQGANIPRGRLVPMGAMPNWITAGGNCDSFQSLASTPISLARHHPHPPVVLFLQPPIGLSSPTSPSL